MERNNVSRASEIWRTFDTNGRSTSMNLPDNGASKTRKRKLNDARVFEDDAWNLKTKRPCFDGQKQQVLIAPMSPPTYFFGSELLDDSLPTYIPGSEIFDSMLGVPLYNPAMIYPPVYSPLVLHTAGYEVEPREYSQTGAIDTPKVQSFYCQSPVNRTPSPQKRDSYRYSEETRDETDDEDAEVQAVFMQHEYRQQQLLHFDKHYQWPEDKMTTVNCQEYDDALEEHLPTDLGEVFERMFSTSNRD